MIRAHVEAVRNTNSAADVRLPRSEKEDKNSLTRMMRWGYFCIRTEKGCGCMAVIKTAILQTHVYKEKSRNITQAAEILSARSCREPTWQSCPEMFCCPYENKYFPEYAETREETPGKNVLGWQQNVGFIL